MSDRRRFLRKFALLFGVGAIGVVSLLPMLVPQLSRQMATLGPDKPLPPLPVIVAVSMIQTLVLLALAVAGGVALAPRLRLRSHLADWAGGEPRGTRAFAADVPWALGLGVLSALVLLALDHFTLPSLGEAGKDLGLTQGRTLGLTVMGALYGGITEELLMRWGLATFLAWLLAKIFRRGSEPLSATAMWAAIAIAAVLFGAGHLPAVVAQGIPLSTPVAARTIVMNAIVGFAFGWLYFCRSLEAAMLAHATVHLTWSGLALLA